MIQQATQHTKTLSSSSVQLNARFISSPLSALTLTITVIVSLLMNFHTILFISDVNVNVGALRQLSSSVLAFFLIKKLPMWKIKKKAELTLESQPTSTAMIHNLYSALFMDYSIDEIGFWLSGISNLILPYHSRSK